MILHFGRCQCSGRCDHDDPDRLDCGDYLAVDTAAGDQLFYAEASDLAAVGAVALRRQFRRLVHSLRQVATATTPSRGAPSDSALGSVPVALLDVRTISGEDNTSGIGVVVLPLDAVALARLRYVTELARDCCSKHDSVQSIRFKLSGLAPQAYSGALVRAIEDVEDQEVRVAQGLECCLGDQLCVEGYQVYRATGEPRGLRAGAFRASGVLGSQGAPGHNGVPVRRAEDVLAVVGNWPTGTRRAGAVLAGLSQWPR